MGERCPLCERDREPSKQFCSLHNSAFRNLEDGYGKWVRALGNKLTKEEYYDKLETMQDTGQAVREVIRGLRGKGTPS